MSLSKPQPEHVQVLRQALECAAKYWTAERMLNSRSIDDDVVLCEATSDPVAPILVPTSGPNTGIMSPSITAPHRDSYSSGVESVAVTKVSWAIAKYNLSDVSDRHSMWRREATVSGNEEDGEEAVSERSATCVPEEMLSTFPYASVGKLYITRKICVGKDECETDDLNVTAFYINQPQFREVPKYMITKDKFSRVLTVAHAFDGLQLQDLENLIFVPASNANPYLVVDIQKHPDYIKDTATNDVCVLFIWPLPQRGFVPIYDVLQPLELVVKKYSEDDGWKVVGYPSKRKPLMCELEGLYLPDYKVKHDILGRGVMTIMMYGKADKGMSGGPWILQGSDNKVNGIQSRANNLLPIRHVDGAGGGSISPYFSKEMLKKLDLEFK